MKKKANQEYHTHMAAHGFKQNEGKSFIHHDISSPVMNDITVQIVLVIMLMGSMHAHLVDVMVPFCWENLSQRRFL